MIKPTDKFKDIFKEFPELKRQMKQIHLYYALFFIPLVDKWLENKTIGQTALTIKTDALIVIKFMNQKIAENTGCLDKTTHIQTGFFPSTLEKMEKMEQIVKKQNPEGIIYLDVSDLPAPEPLMKIREAISKNPPPQIVKVKHRQLPMHLPGYLKDKPYDVFAQEQNNEVVIYVFDRKLVKVIDEQ